MTTWVDEERIRLRKLASSVEAELKALPHPIASWAAKEKTYWDYVQYILKFGRLRAFKKLRPKIREIRLTPPT